MEYTEINSIETLASFLNIPLKQLTGLLYGVKISNCYEQFEIPKRNGEPRVIQAPNKSLKFVQRRLSEILLKRLFEISKQDNINLNIAHAYFKGKSIKSNAIPHRNKKYILNIDLEDFFGTIHFGRVQGFFNKNKYFKLPEVATVIAQLVCYEGKLPQGAPTSPIISNLICQILDYRILKLCKKYRLTYTRYADDLTFSTNDEKFEHRKEDFIFHLTGIVKNSGFKVNEQKTHFQDKDHRQIVTGLSVNKKLNVRNDFYKNTRSMADTLYKTGGFTINGEEGTLKQLEGRFAFINDLVRYNNQVQNNNSLVSNSFGQQQNLSYPKDRTYREKEYKEEYTIFRQLNWMENLKNLTIREKDYQKFLFYKYFIGNSKLTVITEGKTDGRYIKAALKRYHEDYPELIEQDSSGFKYNLFFLPHNNKRLRYFFGYLEGGGDDLLRLLSFFTDSDNALSRNYIKYFKSISEEQPQKPTIFLLDNEKNTTKPLHKFISKLNGKKQTEIKNQINNDFFYPIDFNSFLVTIPIEDERRGEEIEIENLFDLDFLNSSLIPNNCDGKTFDLKKEHGDSTHIGKEIFSNFIFENYDLDEIDFSRFKPLLDILNNLFIDYRSMKNVSED